MRLLQITIPEGERDSVTNTLDDESFDYFVTDETHSESYDGIVYVPVATEAVAPILDDLYQNGVTRDDHVVIINGETDASRKFEKHEGKFRQRFSGHVSIDDTQLRTKAKDLLLDVRSYLTLTVISAVVATAGLLLGSPAVIVGSMVIAPLIGPALGASVGTVLNDAKLFRRGVKRQVVGVVAAVVSSAAFAWVTKVTNLVPPGTHVTEIGQVTGRLTPDFLSLIIALGAGIAGVLSIATGSSVAIVGVMIAAALIPPAATVGIGIAWGLPNIAISSGVLVLVNVLSVNLAALGVFWYLGYRPQSLSRSGHSRTKILKRAGALVVAIALLSLFLVGVTYASIQIARTERAVRNEVENVLDAPSYEELGLMNVKIDPGRRGLFRDPETVIVTVSRPPARRFPQLPETIRRNVAERVGPKTEVRIRFVLVAADAESPDRSERLDSPRANRPTPTLLERQRTPSLSGGVQCNTGRSSP